MSRTPRSALLLPCAVCIAALLPQEPPQDPPRPPTPPAGAEPLPPVQDPPLTRVERRDLLQRFTPATPLEGHWRLTRMSVDGRDVEPVTGYVSFGRRVMTLYVMQGTPGRERLFVQAGVRQYSLQGEALITTALVGHDNLVDGRQLRFEEPGLVERRRVQVAGNLLTISRGEGSLMEFVRIE